MRGFRTAVAGFTAVAAGAALNVTHLVDGGHSLFSPMTGAVVALTFGAVAAALVASEAWRSVPERIALATAPRTKEIFRRIPLSGCGACASDARETQMFPEELAKPSHRAIHPYADGTYRIFRSTWREEKERPMPQSNIGLILRGLAAVAVGLACGLTLFTVLPGDGSAPATQTSVVTRVVAPKASEPVPATAVPAPEPEAKRPESKPEPAPAPMRTAEPAPPAPIPPTTSPAAGERTKEFARAGKKRRALRRDDDDDDD